MKFILSGQTLLRIFVCLFGFPILVIIRSALGKDLPGGKVMRAS